MSVRWIVRREDPRTVGDILAKSGNELDAIAAGRVFVGRRRVKASGEGVAPGDVVTIAPLVPPQAAVILLHEDDLVAALKPAGIPTIADHGGSSHSLLANVALAIGVPVERVHPTSRLDRDVSGVVVFALSKAAKDRLHEARGQREYHRRYLGIALGTGVATGAQGVWDLPIGRATDPRHRRINGRDAVAAETRWMVASRSETATLLAISPVTGRTHQIRLHASHAGMPLLGDRVYGGKDRVILPSGRVFSVNRIALHAARVTVPTEKGPVTILAPVPPELSLVWQELGGDEAAWDTALSCSLPKD